MKDKLQQEFQHLVGHGVDSDLAVRLLHVAEQDRPSENGTPKSLKQCLNRVIADAIETCPIGQDRSDVTTAVFLGPTGVGKTTTIAKLAATFTLGERKKVRLITLDTYRIAAADQLRIYGQIIGVPVQVVSSVAELSEALSAAGDTDRVLIDTTGHSPQESPSSPSSQTIFVESRRLKSTWFSALLPSRRTCGRPLLALSVSLLTSLFSPNWTRPPVTEGSPMNSFPPGSHCPI